MKRLLLLILMLPALSSCGARLASVSDDYVVVSHVTKATSSDAFRIANKECEKVSKQAFPVSEDTGASMATYKCVE